MVEINLRIIHSERFLDKKKKKKIEQIHNNHPFHAVYDALKIINLFFFFVFFLGIWSDFNSVKSTGS